MTSTPDEQDPLPESDWRYRRVLVFAHGAIAMLLIGMVIWIVAGLGNQAPEPAIKGLVTISIGLLLTLALDRLLYLVAPSAEQATKWFATISALKSGITFRKARVETETVSASASEATGAPPAQRPE